MQSWELIILTAADERQAARYRRRLANGANGARYLVVADPARKLGSGGATFHALVAAARELECAPADLAGRRLLMIHSGGDSRRFPQFSVAGKAFAPLPLIDEQGRVCTLLDELAGALSSAFGTLQSGLVVSSGHVLLRWRGEPLEVAPEGAAALGFSGDPELGSRHGVYVADDQRQILRMLHKASPGQLLREAADTAGKVVIDSGVMLFAGETLRTLLRLSDRFYGSETGNAGEVFDLYRDLASALARETEEQAYLGDDGPAVRSSAALRSALWKELHGSPFLLETPTGLEFLHFSTTAEYSALVRDPAAWRDDDRYCATGGSWLAPSSLPEGGVCLGSALLPEVSAEPGQSPRGSANTVVLESRLAAASQLAANCIIANVDDPEGKLRLRPGTAVCQVPLSRHADTVITVLHGIYDNPKALLTEGVAATYFGEPLEQWLADRRIEPDVVWPEVLRERWSLWNAKLFPVHSLSGSWELALWLQEDTAPAELVANWKNCRRLSMADVSVQADHQGVAARRSQLAAQICELEIRSALAERPKASLLPLFQRLPDAEARRQVADALETLALEPTSALQRARIHRAAGDVLLPLVTQDGGCAHRMAHHHEWAFHCVRQAVEGAERSPERRVKPGALTPGVTVTADCPVRLDLAGGWTDTPPYSLDWGGAVLNLAIGLEGAKPIRACVTTTATPELRFVARELGLNRRVESLSEALAFEEVGDPFALQKGALALLGVLRPDSPPDLAEALRELGAGLTLETASAVPKGSGLGTSSILGAAVLAALSQTVGRELGPGQIFDLVLRLEQRLTTGGGWQDQVGGVVGGLKVVRSEPGSPQRPTATPVEVSEATLTELSERLVLFYTGEQRVARNILQVVVGRYLSRDPEVIAVLDAMPPLVEELRETFERGDLDAVGPLLSTSWAQKCVLNEHSTNDWIDYVFAETADLCVGGTLAGAGGGGFQVLLAKDAPAAARMCQRLTALGVDHGGRVFQWAIDGEGLQLMSDTQP